MTTLRKLITGSMRLIRVVGANETPSDEDMQISLQSLRGMLDGMQTDLLNIYTIPYQRFLLEAGKAEYTLGPAVDSAGNPTNADWVVERPVRVERAVLLQFAGISEPSPPSPPTPAPVLTAPTTTGISTTGATVGCTTDTGAGTLYVAVTTGPTPPSASAIIAGTGFSAAGNQVVSSTGPKTLALTGLSAASTYYHHHVQAGAPGGNSNVLSSEAFTTQPAGYGFYVVANSDRFQSGAYLVEARQGGGGYVPLVEDEAINSTYQWTTLVSPVGGAYPADTVLAPPNWASTSAFLAAPEDTFAILVDNDMTIGTITLNGSEVTNALGVQLLFKTAGASATLTYTGQSTSEGATTMNFTVIDDNGERSYALVGPAVPEGGGVDADFVLERLT